MNGTVFLCQFIADCKLYVGDQYRWIILSSSSVPLFTFYCFILLLFIVGFLGK